jgi:hypothetical protein
MQSTALIVLTLAIDRGSDPIEGRITDESGRKHEFSGWMGLARAISEVLAIAPHLHQEDQE